MWLQHTLQRLQQCAGTTNGHLRGVLCLSVRDDKTFHGDLTVEHPWSRCTVHPQAAAGKASCRSRAVTCKRSAWTHYGCHRWARTFFCSFIHSFMQWWPVLFVTVIRWAEVVGYACRSLLHYFGPCFFFLLYSQIKIYFNNYKWNSVFWCTHWSI